MLRFKKLLNTLIVFIALMSLSQKLTAGCMLFEGYIIQGDASFHNGDYFRAVNKYIAAMIDCPYKANMAEVKLKLIVEELQKRIDSLRCQRGSLGDLDRDIRMQLVQIDSLSLQTDRRLDSLYRAIDHSLFLQSQVEFNNSKISRLMDSLPVAGKHITLASETVNGLRWYYYINRLGEELDQLQRWTQGTQFDKYGLVKVGRFDYDCILDTVGNEYTFDDPKVAKEEVLIYSFENRWHLPKAVFLKTNATMLCANGNRILEIPTGIKRLVKLKYLNMADNLLRRFNSVISNWDLETIDLEGNLITEIPLEISRLAFLQNLNLSRNRITTVPAELFDLTLLKELKLAHNRITMVGGGIGDLDSLETLDLSFNELSGLPSSISKLTKLKCLGLTGNRLRRGVGSAWLQNVMQLKQLKYLRIGANPCTDTEDERNAIKDFIRSELPNCIVFFN